LFLFWSLAWIGSAKLNEQSLTYTIYKSVCVHQRGSCETYVVFLVRTSDTQISEVLIRALFIVARSSSSFVLAHGLDGINLMAEGCRHEATRDVLRKVGMVAIGLEHAERTLVRGELDQSLLLISGKHLFLVS
jgi:hypothetical protein